MPLPCLYPQQEMEGTSALNALLGGAGDPALVSAAVAAPAAGSSDGDRPNSVYGNPGPWGRLKRFHIYIEAPRSMVDAYPLPNTRPRWSFPKAMISELPALFRKAGIADAFAESLLLPANHLEAGDMVHYYPQLPDLEAMTAAQRETIYTELAKHPVNEYHVDPVLILTPTIEEWYKSSKMRPDLVAKIKQLSYMRGDCIAFSDLPLLLNYAQSDEEARFIFKTFTRTRSLMVKLEISKEETNTEDLVNYWTTGLGLRRKDIEPLIDSLMEVGGVERLDLVHVLPALTRKLLYTYPGMEIARHGIMPDCHWTSLNFFNYEPHQYLLDSRLATSSVLESFTPVEPPFRYGDILFFLDSDRGDAFHSCVFLADDIVYTKNGRNALSPWILMTLEDVKKIYLYRGNGNVQGYRHKDATGGGAAKQ
jgi:hypothetical protein